MEAKAYAARLADFRKLGVEVVGVSSDDVQTLVRFQKQMEAPQRFVSDPEKKAIAPYQAGIGAGGIRMAKRITFVISKEGKIVHIVYDWSPLTNASSVLKWLKDHPQT